jgi:putative membrane protein
MGKRNRDHKLTGAARSSWPWVVGVQIASTSTSATNTRRVAPTKQVGEADGGGAEKEDPLLLELAAGEPERVDPPGERDAGRALDVAIVAGYLIAVAGQQGDRHSMIKQFSDHAANERTYLAYLRTGLALMGFGFVIERFDLFVRDRSSGQSVGALVWLVSSEVAGFLLLLAGVFVLALSTHRYLRFKKQIQSEEITELGSSRREWILVGVLGSAGVFLCLYVARVFLE